MTISQVTVIGKADDPNYVQQISNGTHQFSSDEPTAHGGRSAGPSPFDYLLAALGSCTSITLRMYAERKGWQIGTVTVNLAYSREKDTASIKREISVSAPLTEEQRTRLADIAERTPVTLAIKQGVQIGTTVAAG